MVLNKFIPRERRYSIEKSGYKVHDVIIIGAGSVGMATGYYLSKQGVRVLLLDEHDPPHSEGSHHGDTRIIRHAYGEGSYYVELALRSQQLWTELEQEVGATIFTQTGVMNVGLKSSDYIRGVKESAERYELPLEIISADDVKKRWQGWQLPDEYVGCYESTSGVLYSEVAIQVYRDGVLKHGGCIVPNSTIRKVIHEKDNVTVETNIGDYSAKQIIITAGGGTNGVLAHLQTQLPLTTVRKTFSWFKQPDTIYDEGEFPAFACDTDLGMYYGFPNMNGAGVKIGRHDGGYIRDMAKPNLPFGHYTDDEGDVSAFATKFLSPNIVHRKGLPCTYTLTPDHDFIIDYVPGYQRRFIVAAGLSGHGFKFASAIGEALSDLVMEGKSEVDLTPFSINRL